MAYSHGFRKNIPFQSKTTKHLVETSVSIVFMFIHLSDKEHKNDTTPDTKLVFPHAEHSMNFDMKASYRHTRNVALISANSLMM